MASFWRVGALYEIIEAGKTLPDSHQMMRIEIVESGEEIDYNLTDILDDPRQR